MTESFSFSSARICGLDSTREPQADAVLDVPAHGVVRYVLDPGGASEHYVLRIALADLPQLPPTDERLGHDVRLWGHVQPFPRPLEVWLAEVRFEPATAGGGWTELIGRGRGRSIYPADEVPVPADTSPLPAWIPAPGSPDDSRVAESR
ncbi:hypothetical protein [Kitasatospora sp. NPDC090091]|uniref:hypothetical protein n=1 Tax=Kitasatospora sp. NPDC090091 TaxID=3364081 RepID=UPI0037FAA195